MKRLFLLLGTICFASFIHSKVASAQFLIGPHGGFNTESNDVLLGVNSHFDLQMGDNLFVGNPSLDFYLFEKDITRTRINVDLLYPFPGPSVRPYVGAGLMIDYVSYDANNLPAGVESTDTDFGLNVKAGIVLNNINAKFRPFVDAIVAIRSVNEFTLRGGILFSLSKSE